MVGLLAACLANELDAKTVCCARMWFHLLLLYSLRIFCCEIARDRRGFHGDYAYVGS